MNLFQNHCSGSMAKTLATIVLIAFGCLQGASVSYAAFGEDVEKPKSEFSRKDNVVTAKLLPRGKSTKVTIGFEAGGGDLAEVKAQDFPAKTSEDIDAKDFRSDLFAIEVAKVAPGGEATLTVRSDYFSSSTRFFLFNEKATPAWSDANAQTKVNADKVRDLTFTVKDGGPYDLDGAADGRIVVSGGPSDSFWGYAVGTLFIRFFGVFLVLGVLQIGMMICGKCFEAADKRKAEEKSLTDDAQAPPRPVLRPDIDPAKLAAISLALHLKLTGGADSGATPAIQVQPAEPDIEPELVAAIAKAHQLQQS